MLTSQFTDIDFINGVFCKDLSIQKALYLHCRRYFFAHFNAIFFVPLTDAEDIFQDSFITLWQNIEHRKIYVEDDIIKGRKGKPFMGTLTSYLMGIAKLKYLELVRGSVNWVHLDSLLDDVDMSERQQGEPIVDDWQDETNAMREALSECISKLSERCSQILNMFYAEQMSLDEMLLLLPTFQSKDALKTAKNKCLTKLRESANEVLKFRLA